MVNTILVRIDKILSENVQHDQGSKEQGKGIFLTLRANLSGFPCNPGWVKKQARDNGWKKRSENTVRAKELKV